MQPFPEPMCDCVCWEYLLGNPDLEWPGSTSRVDTGDVYPLLGTEVFSAHLEAQNRPLVVPGPWLYILYLIVGEPSRREDGDLLTTGNAVHDIDGGDSSLDHLLRVDSVMRVDWLAWESDHGARFRLQPTPVPPTPTVSVG